MIERLPKPLRPVYLGFVAEFGGVNAKRAAMRPFLGSYPASLPPSYEPRRLQGFVRIQDLDAERLMPPSEIDGEVDLAVASGDWKRPAALLAQTKGQWDLRSHAVMLLVKAALKDQAWLMEWEAAQPDDPGALLIRAERTVRHAWLLRSSHRARYLSEGQVNGFLHHIAEAEKLMQRAIDAGPDDPTPYEYMLTVARGRGWSHERMESLWADYTALKPQGFDGHWAALQYWCEKWYGSHQEAGEFAARAAAEAPNGAFLSVLPLIAAIEENDLDLYADYRTSTINTYADACLQELASFPDAYPRTVYRVRHVLAYILNRLGRYEEALEQFRAVDGYVDALPWFYFANTVQEYGWFRRDSVKRLR